MLTLQGKLFDKGLLLIDQYLEQYPVDLNVSLLKISTLMKLDRKDEAKQHAMFELSHYPDDIRLLKQTKPLFDYSEKTLETIANHTNAETTDQFEYFLQLLSRHDLEEFKKCVAHSPVVMDENIASYFNLFLNAQEVLDTEAFQTLDFEHQFTARISPFVFRELRNKQQFDSIIELYSVLPSEYHKRPMIHNITAHAYFLLQRYQEAETFILSNLSLHDNAHLWNVLSQCKERQQQHPLSLCYAIHALTLAPNNVHFAKRVEHLKTQAPGLAKKLS